VDFVKHHDGVITADDYVGGIRDETGLVSVPLVSYANGLRFPVKEITQAAHARGGRVFVDAYQGAGVVPIDVGELDCDYLACGTLKYLLGSPGLAFLYVRPGLELSVDPQLTGWFARKDPYAFDPEVLDYAEGARKFQTGTPAIPAAVTGVAGLSLILETDPQENLDHVLAIGQHMQEALLKEGFGLFSPTDRSLLGPQVTVLTQHADDLCSFLTARGVLASPRGRAIRFSLHYYNTLDDAHQAFVGLLDYRRDHPM
jgi:selenocysteine lyase/cysteine desulfurase